MSDPLRFSVCSFMRVFDTAPLQDALTLPELIEAFERFLFKPRLQARIDKGLAEVDAAEATWRQGRSGSGRTSAGC